MRTASIKRDTKETQIELALDLDGTGTGSIATGQHSGGADRGHHPPCDSEP